MRGVAKRTAIRPDRLMLVDERTCCFCVTAYADRIACDAAMQSLVLEGPMRIVAIAAIYQPFIHLVMKGLRKSRLHISVAGITKLRLRDLEKAGLVFKFVNAVATRATYACIAVCGALEIRMCRGVAFQALFISCLRCGFAKPEDFLYIAATLHMLSAGPVAAFAGDTFASMHQRQARMRILGKLVHHIFVAGHAGVGAQVIGGFIRSCRLLMSWLLVLIRRCIHAAYPPQSGQQDQKDGTV